MARKDDLKNKIRKLKSDSVKRKEWEQKREDLLEKIQAFEDSLKNRFYSHQSTDAKEELLKNLKTKLKDIDAFLDSLEDDEDSEQLQAELLKELIRENPDKKEAYESEVLKQTQLRAECENEQSKLKFLETLKALLLSLEEVYLKVKRMFIFAYILGPNPNYQITQILSAISQLIEKNLEKTPLSLRELKNISKRPWNFSFAASVVKENMPLVEEEIGNVKEAIVKIESEFLNWEDGV